MDALEQFYCEIPDSLKDCKKYFDHFVIEDIPADIFHDKKYVPLREYAVFRMGFSVVTRRNCRILKEIIGDSKVLEIMCGLGSYTATLRSLGVPAIATDDMSWMDYDTSKYQGWKKNAWIDDVESLDAVSAIKKYGKTVGFILMSWPPQNEPYAYEALQAMRTVNPECRMIYIGEEKGGCTADHDFFDDLTDVSHEYPQMDLFRSTYRSWENDGYHDYPFIIK